jgi:hypothetical protein
MIDIPFENIFGEVNKEDDVCNDTKFKRKLEEIGIWGKTIFKNENAIHIIEWNKSHGWITKARSKLLYKNLKDYGGRGKYIGNDPEKIKKEQEKNKLKQTEPKRK